MIVARQFYCLEPVQSKIRPVGHGLILTHSWLVVLIRGTPIGPNHTVPTGRIPF
jgi:hypothetical protein